MVPKDTEVRWVDLVQRENWERRVKVERTGHLDCRELKENPDQLDRSASRVPMDLLASPASKVHLVQRVRMEAPVRKESAVYLVRLDLPARPASCLFSRRTYSSSGTLLPPAPDPSEKFAATTLRAVPSLAADERSTRTLIL